MVSKRLLRYSAVQLTCAKIMRIMFADAIKKHSSI